MTPKSKYISLSLAQRIDTLHKEKGIEPPESERLWEQRGNKWSLIKQSLLPQIDTAEFRAYLPAYDCAELGEMLPECFWSIEWRREAFLQIQKKKDFWYVAYWASRTEFSPHFERYFEAPTEAEARGEMYHYLLPDLIKKV